MPTKKKPEPGDLEFQWGVDDPNNVDRLLAEAQLSLANADALDMNTGAERLAQLPASLAALRRPDDVRGPVRKITEPLANIGGKAMLAAIPAGINPAIGSALLAGGGLATLPEYIRRVIALEGDEERPGFMETAGAGLAALPATGALGALKSLAGYGKEAGALANPAADLLGGRALAYEGAQAARGARPAVPAIEKLMETPSFVNLPRGPVSMAKSSAAAFEDILGPEGPKAAFDWPELGGRFAPDATGSHVLAQGPVQGAQTFADAVRAEAARVKSPFERMQAAGEFAGDRSVRGIGGLETEGPGGLNRLALASMKKRPGISSRLGSVMHDMEENYGHGPRPSTEVNLDIPSVEPISPYERLAMRSQERFGRRFRKE
jgi:hypothetical protein